VNPGDPDSIAYWDSIRKTCCQPGWLDHIKVDTVNENIEQAVSDLRELLTALAESPGEENLVLGTQIEEIFTKGTGKITKLASFGE
jgi:hypothetical protein